MTGSLDISTTHGKEISALLSRYLPGVEVWAFGSRVKWSSRPDSDLDIVAFSGLDQKSEIVQLREALMESSLPFRVDLHVWQELPESFQENIKSGYVVLQEALPGALPRKEQQRAIADALGALANKIRLNLQKNETLEAMARAIYKSWFVDFDPVRAKAEGRNTGLPPHIAELFPDSFQESELGLIPKGWTVKNIDDMTRCVGGATPDTKNPNYWEDGKNHFATPGDMSSLKSPILFSTNRCITDDGVNKISSRILPVGTVLLSSRASIGYLAITEIPVSINQGIIAMICDKGIPNYYVLFWAKANMAKIIGNASGTIFQEISIQYFRAMKIIVPSSALLEMFVFQLEPIYANLVNNLRESEFLSNIRNTLLPKLISGEVRVPEAEKFIAGSSKINEER